MTKINYIKKGIAVSIVLLACASFALTTFLANEQPAGFLQPMALNQSNLANGTVNAYRPWFENGAWQGDLVEYTISSSGTISSSVDLSTTEVTNTGTKANWSARLQFEANEADMGEYWKERKIITWNGTAQKAFRWNKLTTPQKIALDPVTATDSSNSTWKYAGPIIKYIRGDRSNELDQTDGTLRKRYSLLGDIIHSNPVYVAGATTDKDRIYVGANDGMLHVFNANSGDEVYAFIPPSLFGRLNLLTDTSYLHQYYVDGELAVYDAYFDNEWHSVLVGGLGAGGKARFALDVTNADLTDETSISGTNKKILWVNDSDNDDLGDAYGKATVAKLSDGKYYAINGNGYNSVSHKAKLILTDIETGVMTVIDSLVGDAANVNGLSTPVVIDSNNDGIANYAYAGDLLGNLWKFDLTTKALSYNVYAGNNTQPITTQPSVTSHPISGKLVYFGTGKILSAADLDSEDTQALYGIWDKGTEPSSQNLLTQVLTDIVHNSRKVKILTDSAIDWSTHTGWKIELKNGLRIVTNHHLRASRVQTSLVDPVNDENWLLEPNYLTGGSPLQPVFDVNRDGTRDASDNATVTVDGVASSKVISALYIADGLISQPVLVRVSDGEDTKYFNNAKYAAPPIPCTSGCGFEGGHIDVDSDAPASAGNGYGGETTKHTHEYDKTVLQPYVDYFQLDQASTEHVQVDQANLGAKKFFVIVANADLSAKSTLTIGQKEYNIVEYQTMIQRKLATWNGQLDTLKDDEEVSLIFTLAELTANNGTLRNSFNSHSILDGGLHPTDTKCVKGKDGKLTITHGRWRNGALITQLIDAEKVTNLNQLLKQIPTDLATGLEGYGGLIAQPKLNGSYLSALPADGDHAFDTEGNGFLYESTLFWHFGDIAKQNGGDKACYGDSNWEAYVALEKLGISAEQFTELSGFATLEAALAVLQSYFTACVESGDVKHCMDHTKVNDKKLKDYKKYIEWRNVATSEAGTGDGSDTGDGTDSGTDTVGEVLIVGGESLDSIDEETLGVSYQEGRKTWIDITD